MSVLGRSARLLAVVTALLLVPAATAGSPGRWDRVTTLTQSSVSQIGTLRLGDTLHVVWQRQTGPNAYDLLHTSISSAGAVGSATPIVTGWVGIGDAALVPTPDGGLRVFFSGTRSTTPGEPLFGLNTATAPSAGRPWSVAPASIATRDFAYGRTPAAALAPDGTPFQAWYSAATTVVHRGLDPATPDFEYPAPGPGTSVRQNIVADPSSGRMFVAWCTFGQTQGVFVQEVNAGSGAPAGPAQRLTGSTSTFEGQEHGTCNLEGTVAHRTALAARAGGGIYVATAAGYPSQTRVVVWRLTPAGALAQTMQVASSASVSHALVAVGADPGGRIWVAWRQSGSPRVYARRSNRASTAFGAVVSAAPPPGGAEAQVIDLAPQAGRVDVLARYGTVSAGSDLWHSQLLPGLTLTAGKRTFVRFKRQTLTFVVRDAGEPVPGATIAVSGRTARTNSLGRARVVVTPRGSTLKVTASRAGYVGATLTLRGK